MKIMSSVWLFRFTSYSYCQGTRDNYRGDMRLLIFTLPCEEWEAKAHLLAVLINEGIELNVGSIESLTYKITNS
jgi:hypothetical protein